MIDWDLKLQLKHIIYIFIASATWIICTIWMHQILKELYTELPQLINVFLYIAYGLGGAALIFGVVVFLMSIDVI